MAISKYRVGTTVTIAAAGVSGDGGGGRRTSGATWSTLVGEVFRRGQIVICDSAAGNGAASQLFTALSGAGANLVQVTTDADADHSAISN